jgi:tRNA (mo5U34)-methyltransferase
VGEQLPAVEARRLVAERPFWYHTIELGPGLVTPGLFDLRPVVDEMPWPDVRGKRCLDVGTYDGFLAFEMERRGAAEVVAVDIEDRLWDWPADARPGAAGETTGGGFQIAARALGSRVSWQPLSIYDLDPALMGRFDVVVCGGILQHLRDPVRALEAVRSVCGEWFLSAEHIDLWLTVLFPRRPVARLNGSGPWCDWWASNAAGHMRMLYSGGFAAERVSKPFMVELNREQAPRLTPRAAPARLAQRLLTGSRRPGVLHRAVLARPRL